MRSQSIDTNFDHYDFRHTVIAPARMTAAELQDGADWLYSRFYRMDRILLRTLRSLFTSGPVPAYLTWKLNMTYRYDNKREHIVGRNPATSRSRRPANVETTMCEDSDYAA